MRGERRLALLGVLLGASACNATSSLDFNSLAANGHPAPEVAADAGSASASDTSANSTALQKNTSSEDVQATAQPSSDGASLGTDCAAIDPCETGSDAPEAATLAQAHECVRAVAREQGALRQVARMPDGNLFAVTAAGEIRRYQDWSCDGEFDAASAEQMAWAQTGGGANNVALDPRHGFLYAGSPGGVVRFSYCSDGGAGTSKTLVVNEIANSAASPTFASLRIQDGYLYVASNHDSVIKRFAIEDIGDGSAPITWNDGETVSDDAPAALAFVSDLDVARADHDTRYVAQNGAIYRIARQP